MCSPINGTTFQKGWTHVQSIVKIVQYRVHGYRYVQIFFNIPHEQIIKVGWCCVIFYSLKKNGNILKNESTAFQYLEIRTSIALTHPSRSYGGDVLALTS